jgi:hypothetical protein
MKKSLLTILLAGAISLPLYAQIQGKNNTESENYLIKGDIETKIYGEREDWKYIKMIGEWVAKKDKEYLYENTAGIEIFKDETALKYELIKDLEEKKHTYQVNNWLFYELPSQINELSIDQNKVIYLMMSSLKDSSFVNKIGEGIEGSKKNIYSESGGIVNFKEENKINIKLVESELSKLKDEKNDDEYQLPAEDYFSEKLAYVHMHIGKDGESPLTGLAIKDILALIKMSIIFGITNEFIITSLSNWVFNIDYFGIDPEKDEKVRIIDLGNYSYDTLSVK